MARSFIKFIIIEKVLCIFIRAIAASYFIIDQGSGRFALYV